MEIERKFLLKDLPSCLNDYECYRLEQAYITTKPVIRIRKKVKAGDVASSDAKYILTVKSSGLMMREEYEIDIDEEGYNTVLKKAEGNIITKDRYIIPLDSSLKMELDIFRGIFQGLVMAEVEFPDEESAKKYTPPEFVSEEVTFDRRFSNSAMSKMSSDEISALLLLCNKNK